VNQYDILVQLVYQIAKQHQEFNQMEENLKEQEEEESHVVIKIKQIRIEIILLMRKKRSGGWRQKGKEN